MENNEDVIWELITILKKHYLPADNPADADEMKSSIDLIEEFDCVSDVSKDKLFLAMQSSGFKSWYTGSEFVWLLKLM